MIGRIQSASPVSWMSEQAESTFFAAVYRWMATGLCLTAATGYFVVNSPGLSQAILRPGVLLMLIIAELALVVFLSLRVNRMSSQTATACFLGYAALNGVTLIPIVLMYTASSVTSTFMICGGMFGAMAVWGRRTERSLTGLGSFCMMGLVGLVIASLAMLFFQSPMLHFVYSIVGVIVFCGLTAWDVQKLKTIAVEASGSRYQGETPPLAIYGALTLYLDFINLFIMLLRLFGDRRD